MQEVRVRPVPVERLAAFLPDDRMERLAGAAQRAQAVFGDRTVWHVSATAHGGGVAEMLHTLLAYANGAGIENRWLVLDGDSRFFATTKRLHNLLHGDPGDGRPLGPEERAHYEAVLRPALAELTGKVSRDDIVLLHDPQTAGLAAGLRAAGALVVWRCHVGRDRQDDVTRSGWDFLQRYVEQAHALVFSRRAYAPDWAAGSEVAVIPPSIDPFSMKNRALTEGEVAAVLARARLVPALDVPLVVQVSRWDRLKDMAGVMEGFARALDADGLHGAHLVLAGPEAAGVADDPEASEVLGECRAGWRLLPPAARGRVHLAAVPMADPDENALIVNALQRHAAVVVQKSLAEGFGLTVTEAMWKGRPVVASRLGGIQDQITDGRDGLLVHDPHDLDELATLLRRVLDDAGLAARLGPAAHARVLEEYVGDRHLEQYVDLLSGVVRSGHAG